MPEYPKMKRKKKVPVCEICKEAFIPSRIGQRVCGVGCSIKKAKLDTEKEEQKKKRQERAEKLAQRRKDREKKAELKQPRKYKQELQAEVNHIARLIDKGWPCISSGIPKYIVNAGHYYSVGAFPELRYNLLNIYAQSVHDNKERGGNELMYGMRLKELFGTEIFEEIETLPAKYKILDISVPALREKLKIARRIVRRLKVETEDIEQPFTLEQRIIVRRALNEEIGLY